MREHKYRVWDTEGKRIITSGIDLELEALPCDFVGEYDFIGFGGYPKRFIFLEYTGAKDKNGKEIYECDIFHIGDINIKYKVTFYKSQFVGQQVGNKSTIGLSHWIDRVEVIGNECETHELLGKIGI